MTVDLSPGGLVRLAAQSVKAPRPTMRRLLDLNLPASVLWHALALVIVLSVILAELGNILIRAALPPGMSPPVFLSPVLFGALQFAAMVVIIGLVDRVGRAMGGKGDFAGALMTVTWVQAIMVLLQIAQSLMLFIAPPFAGLLLIAGVVLFFYLLSAFVAELHGFASVGRTFAMILFVMVGVALAISFFLTLSGVTITP
ncbi:Yip1 family protein [Palleronia caenipelagi]|uniref:YIP1 family protein n=1 Tax=Palleronia caenipelagi TaxID=2489174 RepID=A0A547Q2Y8_9RHOB|nr:Yip1 family protein [Palleronia caenipelagi]TRD20752.1 YIP1 family protein [Palleronia caenipelagi]